MHIYLDNASTTKIDPKVNKHMTPYLLYNYANASSAHSFGFRAKEALTQARTILAESINAFPHEIIFTSGGTEANNLALKGLYFSEGTQKNHIITTEIEHDSILRTCQWLESQGAKITYLPVNQEGVVDPHDLENAITPQTLVVSMIHGNNEVGTIQNLDHIGEICRQHNVFFHSDACQSFTKTNINVDRSHLDLLTINAHKIHGPKGVGALYVRQGTPLTPLLHGGGQEFGTRSSTENIPGIVGFAKAVELANESDILHMQRLRDWFLKELQSINNVRVNGSVNDNRLCNNINISFFMLEGELIRDQLSKQGIFVSTGSACSSHASKTSHVMKALKVPMEYLHGNIRISLSKWTTKTEMQRTLNALRHISDTYRI